MTSSEDKKKIQKCWEAVTSELTLDKTSDDYKKRRKAFDKDMKLLIKELAEEEEAEVVKPKSVKKKVTIKEEPKVVAKKKKSNKK